MDPLAFADEARRQSRRAVVATVYRGPSNAVGARLLLRDDGVEASNLSGPLRDAVRTAAGEALSVGRTWSGPCGGADVLVAVAAKCGPVVVVLGAQTEAVTAELAGLPVRTVQNADWSAGMGSSLRVGLRALDTKEPTGAGLAVDAALVMLCDQLRVDAGHLRALVEARERAESSPASLRAWWR